MNFSFLFFNLPQIQHFSPPINHSQVFTQQNHKPTISKFSLKKENAGNNSSFVIPSLTTNIGVRRKCFHLRREVEASDQTTLNSSLIIHIVADLPPGAA